MTKYSTVLATASLATLLALFAPTPRARADIFQWQYINPANPSQGKQPSTLLCPGGAGANAVPQSDLSFRNLTMAYLIGADLGGATASTAILTNAELTQANLTSANFSAYYDESYGYFYTDLTGANLSRESSFWTITIAWRIRRRRTTYPFHFVCSRRSIHSGSSACILTR